MLNAISYDIASITILLSIFVVHKVNRNKLIIQNKIFTLVCYIGIIAAFSDIFDILGNTNPNLFPEYYYYLTSYLYFFSLNSIPFVYVIYIISLRSNDGVRFSMLERIVIYIPYAVLCFTIFTNFFTEAIFYYDKSNIYHRGKYQIILYVISFYYMIYGSVYATIIKAKLTRLHIISTYCFVLCGCGGALLQMFVPGLYISVFGATINIMVVYMAILHPDEGIDKRTGIFNITYFSQVIKLKLMSKEESTLFLIYIEDIKLLNQAIGIEKTDEYLKLVAKYLNSIEKQHSFYLSGGMFGVILDGIDEKKNSEFVERVHKRFENAWTYEESALYMSMKMLELFIPDDIMGVETVEAYKQYLKDIKVKEQWFYRSKDTSISITKRQTEVKKALVRAIENDGFEVYYQPIYSTEHKKITSGEALLRLNDPELGFIPPDEFIVVAENEGYIVKIGEMVFENVCKFLSENDLFSLGIEYIEINLSVIQCIQENLAENFIRIMKKYGIDSKRINLEITETAANSSPKMLIRNMTKIYENGVSFSLDDFGSGYSNMNSILKLPLDIVKFDKTIIDTIDKSDKGKIVFLSSIAMVKEMNMKIVAEGIETEEQKKIMEKSGVEYLQGYFFSKPVPGKDYIDYVKNYNCN